MEEGDLDSAEGHSQPIVGTLPLTDQSLPDSVSTEGDPQEKHPPPSPSEALGPTSTDIAPRNTSNSPPDLGDNFEKRVQNLVKAREETVTTPPPEESKQTVATPPSVPKEPTLQEEEFPSKYPFLRTIQKPLLVLRMY